MRTYQIAAASLVVLTMIGGTALAASDKTDFHDPDANTVHVGKGTTPAMGAKASQPTKGDLHDPDSNTIHVNKNK